MTEKLNFITQAPAHSDFMVYWTGRDIMKKYGDLLPNAQSYKNDVITDFLKRLQDILEYGLWMRKHEGTDYIHVNKLKFPKPDVARLCFTELKISDSLLHARKFGPLGIGFKRFFIINRMGSPVYYVPDTQGTGLHSFFPPCSNLFDPENPPEICSYFKNMSQGRNDQGYIGYDLYEESEWRIIYSENIKSKMPSHKHSYFINPKDPTNKKHHEFYQTIYTSEKPDYIVPVDGWLALIIYPNLQIKNAAYEDTKIRDLLTQLKDPKSVRAEGIPPEEVINFPAELDIGAIKNF